MGIMQDKRRVIEIPLDDIYPNPAQPRRSFPEKELLELSRSIRQNGLLQPLSVRRTKNGYELIAGERRWRACRLAGLDSAACIVNSCSDKQSAVLAMTENLQRQDLQIFEEAEGIRRLIEEWGVTQEEAALRLGKSQSTLANKLRLLRLTQEERKKISENGLTERHARALLRVDDVELRGKVLDAILAQHLNVQQTDQFIERILSEKEDKPKNKKRIIVKDIRIFMNTISHAVKTMQLSGIQAKTIRNETDDYIECIVRIPKTGPAAGRMAPRRRSRPPRRKRRNPQLPAWKAPRRANLFRALRGDCPHKPRDLRGPFWGRTRVVDPHTARIGGR